MPKKKTIFLLIFCLIISTLFYGCEKKQSNEKNKFAIYFVKAEDKEKALSYGRDENGEYVKPESDIKLLTIEKSPILTEKDIKKFNWNRQEIEVTDEYLKNHEYKSEGDNISKVGSKLLGTKELDAVIIVVNGERIYFAGFPIDERKSCFPPEYMISDASKNTISIKKNGNKGKDLRKDERIYKALNNVNILVKYISRHIGII